MKKIRKKALVTYNVLDQTDTVFFMERLSFSYKYLYFFIYSMKRGKKLKLNNFFFITRLFLKQLSVILNYKFKKDFFDFKFLLFQNILSDYFQVYLTKNFKTINRKRKYLYIFLSKSNRYKEVFKWLHYLTKFQNSNAFFLNFSWLVFDTYYFTSFSEVVSINSKILTTFTPKKIQKNTKRKKFRYLGLLMRI